VKKLWVYSKIYFMKEKNRCFWCLKDELYMRYHDEEWGIPVHDDTKLFEMLNLEGAQAGLSWYTVLVKRENYRKAFSNWEAKKIALYTPVKVAQLMQDAGIIRNRLKIEGTIKNAKAFISVQKEFGTFDKYIWQFVGGKQIKNSLNTKADISTKTELSDAMSKDLLNRGFKFVGSTICYAYMQATGMVNDHMNDCWKKNVK
jgi:DNA-3-methyladenine glycosylase I